MKKLLTPLLLFINLQASSVTQPVVKPTKTDPLSKITVTSKKAVGRKDKECKSAFNFSYLGDVKTTLADGSFITADQLDITIDKEGIATQEVVSSLTKEVRHDTASQIKKIAFVNHVSIKHEKKTILADRVELDTQKRCCMLIGNVTVSQDKAKEQDIPINLTSDKAILSLDSGSVTFIGSPTKPVSTTINVTDVKMFEKKDKIKKKKREKNTSVTSA